MSEPLGKIEKPEAEGMKQGKKLFFVPLVFIPIVADPGFEELFKRYWEQVEAHLTMLEEKLVRATRIYHELIAQARKDGLKDIEKMSLGSYSAIKKRVNDSSELVSIEDRELLNEFLDWGRCLAIGLHSRTVFSGVYEAYVKAQKKRNESISRIISDTLDSDGAGILFMREGHQVQFPSDIQVFYVAPPALDEIRRWVREHENTLHEHSHEEASSNS
jgi:hypothetical protein